MYVRCVLYSKNNLNKLTEEWYFLKQNDYYGIKKKHLSFHRKNGPSILYENGGEVWYLDGNLHREFGLPALTLQKNKEFFLRGKQYEIEEDELGTKILSKNSKEHSIDDRPSIVYKNGTKEWHSNGDLHRKKAPAVEYANGDVEYWQLGKLHREDGPAVIYGNKQYWFNHGAIYAYSTNGE
jgi:hypothetical protein